MEVKTKKHFNDLIKSLTLEMVKEEELDELTVTGNVDGYNTPFAFGDNKEKKMKLKVLRFSSQADSTSGILMEESDLGLSFICYTLEDERRVLKVKGETRVPYGLYNLSLRLYYSLYLIEVSFFE